LVAVSLQRLELAYLYPRNHQKPLPLRSRRQQGELAWHKHEDEDELSLVLKGQLRIEMETGNSVELGEGQMFVVPKGVRHNPVAREECHVMLIERKSTLHTGDVVTEKTRTIAAQLRPV
jgi:mannose-6-phosphate isomerase-like protein (cupin superfamily)